jgi:AraC family transcriptional regulator, transcriptional activator of pobA
MSSIIDLLKRDGFTVYALKNRKGIQYAGRDGYHKVVLISGIGVIKYNSRVYKINGSVLLVTSPGVGCTWCLSTTNFVAYVCAFKKNFLNTNCIRWSQDCDDHFSLYPVFNLNAEQEKFVKSIFCRMIEEQKITYAFKKELMKNQLCILTHMALRMTASRKIAHSSLCPKPTAAIIFELVEIGFSPIGQIIHFN